MRCSTCSGVELALLDAAPRSSCGSCARPGRALPACVSSSVTGMPALRKFIAMPPPMVPAPITPTCLIVAQRRVVGHVGDLAGGALGEERVAQRLAIRASASARTKRFALERRCLRRTAASPPLRPRRRIRSGAGKFLAIALRRCCARSWRKPSAFGCSTLQVAHLRQRPPVGTTSLRERDRAPASRSPSTTRSNSFGRSRQLLRRHRRRR